MVSYLLRDVWVFASHELEAGFDDRHAGAETAERLGRLDAYVTPAQHDQMRRKIIEFERLDVGERARRVEPGNVGNGGVRAEIEDNLAAGELADAAVVERDLDRLRADEPSAAHDELRAALRVGLQVEADLAFDHILLAAQDLAHVRFDVAYQRAETPRRV